MSGTQPPVKDDDSENKSESPVTEKEVQQAQEQVFQEEVPESAMGNLLLQLVGSVGMVYLSDRAKALNAFRFVKSKDFAQSLLRIKDPRLLADVKRQLDQVKQEVARQQKRRGGKGTPGDEFRVGIGRSKQTITIDELNRRLEAYKLARSTQGKINGEIITEKITTTCQAYGLNPKGEGRTQLQRGMAKWLKKYPHGTIDQYLLLEGRKVAEKQLQKEGKKIDKKDLEAKQRTLGGEKTKKGQTKGLLATINEAKIKEHLPTLRSARKVIRDILDPSNIFTPLTYDQTRQIVRNGEYVSTQQAKTTTPPPAPQPTVQPVTPPSPPVVPQMATVKPPRINLANRFTNFFQTRWNNITSRAGNFFRPLTSRIGNFFRPLTSFFSNSRLGRLFGKGKSLVTRGLDLLMNGGKMLLNRGLDAVLPGLGVAIGKINDVIKAITGIDIEGTLIAVVVIVPVVLVMIFVLYAGPSLSQIPNWGGQNMMSVSLINNQELSFREFENKFLTLKQDLPVWQRFEFNNLINSAP